MQTDVTLKRLFKACGRDLLRLTGDQNATVLAVDVREIHQVKRSVDCLVQLRRGEEIYYRHIEFQSGNDPHMAERCFRYNALLLLELRTPVVTTVIYLVPPAPPGDELVYRVTLGGSEVNAWRFRVVRLREIKAETALESGAAGFMALVPLLDGGSPAVVLEAARKIRRHLPKDQLSDPETILWPLAASRYNDQLLMQAVGRRNMNALLELIKNSPLWQKARAEGQAAGEAKGIAKGEVELILRQLNRRLGAVAESQKKRIRRLDLEKIQALAESLLEFKSRADLVRWLKQNAS